MRTSTLKNRGLRYGLAAAALVASGVAIGLPWDVDMADSQALEAFDHVTTNPPAGTVAQPHLLTPRNQSFNPDRLSEDANAMTNPYEVDDELIALGGTMYQTYCWPCHGDGKALGPVADRGYPGVIPLFGTMSTLPTRSDGFIHQTIKNGGAIMPSYGWALNGRETWALVEWLRTQPKAGRGGAQ